MRSISIPYRALAASCSDNSHSNTLHTMKYKIYYKPKGDDLCSVWTEASSKEEAINKVKREYWDIERIIDVQILR